jgi:tetratricopeptide (TPR) repeat protein
MSRAVQKMFERGFAFYQQGAFAQAEKMLKRTLEMQPNHFDALHFLGIIALRTNRLERGVELTSRAIKSIPSFAPAHNNLGMGLQKLKRNAEALICYDRAIALKPDFAEAYNNQGNALQDMNRYEEALSSYDKAIELTPDYAEAYNNRGVVLLELSHIEEAIASYDRAIALRADYAEAYNNRGNALQNMGRLEEALASCDRAIALKPDFAEAYNNRGNVLQDMNRYEEALSSYDKAIELKPDYAEAYTLHGMAMLVLGRFEQGWQQYEWRKKVRWAVGNRPYPQPLWLGKENIAGKTMFLHWEQGLGDTIQFIRYVKFVRAMGAKVIVSVQDPLLRLLKQMDPNIEFLGSDTSPDLFEHHCSLMSLPLALGTTVETIPSEPFYLQADKELSAHWEARLSQLNGLRVGLVWAGGKRDRRDATVTDSRRSIPLATYAPLASVPNVSFISLQKGPPSAEARMPPEGMILHDWTDDLLDFLDTAALIDGLDLVISVDTAVAHLAGALGKPVWVLNRSDTCWRWLLDRADSPWYASLRLFRQREMGNWSQVIEEVTRELQSLVLDASAPGRVATT